ncbi:hypothetical protein E4V51_31005, partial [Paenibacillus sp. 28ISP30-2]|nr:hypothetical protein [Paenibacillus sp. 28ISP30-2]
MKKKKNNSEELAKAQQKLAGIEAVLNEQIEKRMSTMNKERQVKDAKEEVHALVTENHKLAESLAETNVQLTQIAVEGFDQFPGKAETAGESPRPREKAFVDWGIKNKVKTKTGKQHAKPQLTFGNP